VRGSDAITIIDEAGSAEERVSTTSSTSLKFGVPGPRVWLGLVTANYSFEDVGLNTGDAALAVVMTIIVVK